MREGIIQRYTAGRDVLDLGGVDHGAQKQKLVHNTWLHAKVAKSARKCIGVDILENRVRDACGSGYTFLVANAEALPFAASFDVVLAGEIVEHVHNMGQVLDSAWRALRRSGHLIVTTPNNFALSGLLYAGVRGREACHPEHVCYYSVQTLSYIVERHGFKIEDVCVVARQAKRSFIQRLYEALERWHPILAETIVLIASKRDERIKYSANW